ncbi:hypothetical protein [Halomonas mongoliensis]|uniref:hypothetical protein n=1 Tax=Halomonas mongoliensis TaxID=321265 RepID=UPI00403A7D88
MSIGRILLVIFKVAVSVLGVLAILIAIGMGKLIGRTVVEVSNPHGLSVSHSSSGRNQDQAAELLGLSREEYDKKMRELEADVRGMSSKEANVAALNAASREINSQLPQMISEMIRRDTTSVGPGLTINFHHTVFQEGLSSDARLNFSTYMEGSIRTDLCDKDWAQRMHRQGGAYRYIYHSEDGALLADIRVGSDECH